MKNNGKIGVICYQGEVRVDELEADRGPVLGATMTMIKSSS
jgi:hypothetical protein